MCLGIDIAEAIWFRKGYLFISAKVLCITRSKEKGADGPPFLWVISIFGLLGSRKF